MNKLCYHTLDEMGLGLGLGLGLGSLLVIAEENDKSERVNRKAYPFLL